jgi:hypothetical protein
MLPDGGLGLYTVEEENHHSSRGASNLTRTPENCGRDRRRLPARFLSRRGQLSASPDIALTRAADRRGRSTSKGYHGASGKLSPPTSNLTYDFDVLSNLTTSRSDIRTIANEPVIDRVEPGADGGDAAKSGTDSGDAAKRTRRRSLGSSNPVPPIRQQRRRLAPGPDLETGQKKEKPRQRGRSSLGGPNKPNRHKGSRSYIDLAFKSQAESISATAFSSSSTLTGEDSKALLEKLEGKCLNPRGACRNVSPNVKKSFAPSRMNRIRSPRRKEYARHKSAFRRKQASALKENISLSTLVQLLAIDSLEDMSRPSTPPLLPSQNIKSIRSQQLPPLPIDPEAGTLRTSNRTLDNLPPLSASNTAKAKASIGRLPLSPSASSDSSNYPIPERRGAYWLDKSVSPRLSTSKAFSRGLVAEASGADAPVPAPATRRPQPKGGIWNKLEQEKTRQEKLRARIQSASNQRAAASTHRHSTVQAY